VLLTVGHGTLPAADLAALLGGAGVRRIADVRAFPGSRRHPHVGREQLERWLPEAGVDYRWLPALGGRRRPVPGSRHVALRNDAFRAYADHMATPVFRDGVRELLRLATGAPTAALCSEAVWWRCHRRLVADHVVLLEGVEVHHLLHDGRRTPHAPTSGVRVDGDALVYDVADGAPGSGSAAPAQEELW
jgi:uncharacterized protein (DUF488 family)